MFSTDSCYGGTRLRYAPFAHYQLPELVYEETPDGDRRYVPFKRRHESEPDFTRPLYRLRWPGETDRPDSSAPIANLGKIPWLKGIQPGIGDKVQISDIWSLWAKTEGAILPESIAYHVAVNPTCMGQEAEPTTPTIAGLPGERVDQVFNARFCPDANALATLRYLKWQAESLRDCPFFRGFDTNIRETLHELQHEAVRLYFYLLGDYRYDHEACWWDRDMSRFVWQRLATYLHWVGRTGSAMYGSMSHIRSAGIRQDVVKKHMQDVVDCDHAWIQSMNYTVENPVENPVEGPSIEP